MNYNPAMIMFGEQQQQHQHLYGIILLEDEMRHTLFLLETNNYLDTVQCVSYNAVPLFGSIPFHLIWIARSRDDEQQQQYQDCI